MFNIEIQNPEVIDRFAQASQRTHLETKNWLVDMAMWIKQDLKNRVPVKTGALKASLRYELSQTANGGEATFHSLWYGKILDEGSKPFTITAQKGKPMVFNRGSDKVFAMTVRNPGIKARDFTEQSLEAAEHEADRQAEERAASLFRAVIG